MSFFRHPEIFPSDRGATLSGCALAHRLDEFPAGYSSAGCSPAEPASASPTGHHFAVRVLRRTMIFQPTACCRLTGCLSRGVHRSYNMTRRVRRSTSVTIDETAGAFPVSPLGPVEPVRLLKILSSEDASANTVSRTRDHPRHL